MVLKKSSQSLLPPIGLLACRTQITGSRTALSAERALHVDHDQRRPGRVQSIEQMIAAAPLQDAIDDFLADRDRMHISDYGGRRIPSTAALLSRCHMV